MIIQKDFEAFMKRRQEAASAYVRGDPAPVNQLATVLEPASFFGPGGGIDKGAAHIRAAYRDGSAQFEAGSDSTLEILQQAANDTIAYWTGIQHATAKLKGKPEKVPMDLRITELFRREDGEWRLVHRHADMLKADTAKTG